MCENLVELEEWQFQIEKSPKNCNNLPAHILRIIVELLHSQQNRSAGGKHMPWSVRLQDEKGRPVLDRDVVFDGPLPVDEESYRLLCYVDPYGDTVFNNSQMKTFLFEWDRIKDELSAAQIDAWKQVREFAMQCANGVHLYLKFIGD
ncbi:MAG: hypothetical protein DMG67_11675 [Acidobacteria bacterium]|nr:MAG: hypothetical protein DMG67_11675 [Acidobacteriota bacterium]